MNKPTVGDVWQTALPQIAELHRQFWRSEWWRDQIDPSSYDYVCLKCQRRHYLWSEIGKRHYNHE